MEEYRKEKAGAGQNGTGGTMEEKTAVQTAGKNKDGKPADEKQPDGMEAVLKRLEESERERNAYARRQFYLSAVTAACSVMVLVLLLAVYVNVVPKVQEAFTDIRMVTDNLNRISSQLSETELDQMVRNVDRMALTSEESAREALEKIRSIDIDELNRAIQGLSDVVQPFADFMKLFGH